MSLPTLPAPRKVARRGVLALDIATTTGWAFFGGSAVCGSHPLERVTPSGIYSGVFRAGVKKSSLGEVYHLYRTWLGDMLSSMKPYGVVYEAPWVNPRGGFAREAANARRLFGLAAITEEIVYQRQLPWVRQVKVHDIKKHIAGSGRASKEEVIAGVRALGFDVSDDNEADAIALGHYTWVIERNRK